MPGPRDRTNLPVGHKEFDVVADGGRGRVLVPVPFDPDAEWGAKTRHPVGGTINRRRVRGVVELHDGVHGFVVGVAWLRGCPLAVGDRPVSSSRRQAPGERISPTTS